MNADGGHDVGQGKKM